ncbi:hypothetical protein AA0X95_10695 [Bacillus sp. 1P10SD]|uniref:hypothetical protein n=1 Tax=Bacillus sp. 1P10SD TaxID=3132265 RepID=UPI0039A4F3CA
METILFMIIVGIISTIVGKSKSNQGKPRSKPFSVEPMKDVRTLLDEFINKKPRETFSVETKTDSKQSPLDNFEKEYEQVRQESESSRTRMAAARKQAEKIIVPSKVDNHQQAESSSLEHPDLNTLVNGIIWSEILGEPRAKRPYFSKRR